MSQRAVTPSELISRESSGSPGRFRLHPERASFYSSRLGLGHTGPDIAFDCFRPLSGLDATDREGRRPITYLTARRFAAALAGFRGLTVVTTPELLPFVPPENGVLLTNDLPRNSYYSVLEAAHALGLFERLETHISSTAKVATSAVIFQDVFVSDHAEIEAGAVLYPNTYIGPGVSVKPNAVIGGDGFEATSGDGRHIVPRVGGVWLAEGARVGSCTCIDKGVVGDFTEVGSHTFLDNLVHFGHCARAGRFCSIIAGAGIHGSATLEDGVWVGPSAQVNQNIRVGAHSYIGTGAVVTRDIEAYSLAYGSPAKPWARVCECRNKLSFEADQAACDICGKEYVFRNGRVQRR